MQNPNRKKSLCRYYLRGLCKLSKQQCQFAHGIKDLNYGPMAEGEEVEFDYHKDIEFNQKAAVKGPKVYINLYQYQQDKKYTLQQLNEQRLLRVEIRKKMHRQCFFQFMNLLEETYPQMIFTENFLLKEYTRVGFNKLMTRIKFSHLTDTLCQGNEPKYFMKQVIIPPHLERSQNCIFRRASEKEIMECYKEQCSRLLKSSEEPPEQANLKKQLFQMTFENPHIPPLNMILKEKKTNFTDFLKFLNEQEDSLIQKIRLDPSVEQIKEVALKYLQQQSKRLLSWNDLYSYLSKQLKLNNANILNQVRPLLLLKGYYFFYMPTIQFILNKDHQYPFEKEAFKICQCSLKESYDLSSFDEQFQKNRKQINFQESVDINDWNSLMSYADHILGSKIIAIDLEGRLRKGGYVEMVQINNHRNTFLLDFFLLFKNKDQKTIDLTKKILRNLLVNGKILKIFHDCRHDSLALHEFLDSCIINVFDTSACQTFKRQVESYEGYQGQKSVNQAKKLITQCNNIQTPGLNEVLKRYKASHGINKHKERFHRLWREGEEQIFAKRPMDPDYREYCIRDVLDLPQIYQNMMAQLPQWTHDITGWVSAHYVSFGYTSSSKAQE